MHASAQWSGRDSLKAAHFLPVSYQPPAHAVWPGAPCSDWKTDLRGLVGLFAITLSRRLLYAFERPQYAGLLKANAGALHAASVYGAEHLVRLLCTSARRVVF